MKKRVLHVGCSEAGALHCQHTPQDTAVKNHGSVVTFDMVRGSIRVKGDVGDELSLRVKK